jgi:hypothetical protein
VGSWSESGKVKLSTVASVKFRILGISSIPPYLKAAVMLLSSRMSSVTWTEAALEAAIVMVGSWIGMVDVWRQYLEVKNTDIYIL